MLINVCMHLCVHMEMQNLIQQTEERSKILFDNTSPSGSWLVAQEPHIKERGSTPYHRHYGHVRNII